MTTQEILKLAKQASRKMAGVSGETRNGALLAMADALCDNIEPILCANRADLERAKGTISEVMMDRLRLDEARIRAMADGIRDVAKLDDPTGRLLDQYVREDGLTIRKVSVPLGVIAIIYESRPNVTVDAFALAYKSANAILLRGSSSALNSNMAIVKAIKEGLASVKGGIPEAVELAPCKSHDEVTEILTAVGKVDLVLPRGSAKLIKTVVETAKVPVIETGSGVCHLYVDQSADLDMAARIAVNGKIQRPGVCNALECIVVNKEIAADFIPKLAAAFDGKVEVHADEESYPYFEKAAYNKLVHAQDQDFGFEFLDLICAIKTVASIDQAIEYINTHNTKHSESIITNNMANARLFQAKIDASCVYVNASTRFTDGGEFGFGAELGISTQKIHARGPMGIKALTTTKYLIDGNGQIRE